MRKIMLMVFVASVVALMLAASPASADEDDGFDEGRLLLVDDGRFFDDGGRAAKLGDLPKPDNPPDVDVKWILFFTDLYSLKGANLEGAAMLDGADLTNADLRGVRGITAKQLER